MNRGGAATVSAPSAICPVGSRWTSPWSSTLLVQTPQTPQYRPTRTTRGAASCGALVLLVLLVVSVLEVLAFLMSSAADAASAANVAESLASADAPVECSSPPLFSTRVQRVLVPRVIKWRELRLRWSWESSVKHRSRAGKTHGLSFPHPNLSQ
jgi:hypothetical protein